MIDYRAIFHTGIVVANLTEAQALYGRSMTIDWTPVRVFTAMQVWTPQHGQQSLTLPVCYSRQGPHHIELIETLPGSFYDPVTLPDRKHLGLYVDDVVAEATRLAGLGWTLLAASRAPEEGYGSIAYLRAPDDGLVLELVSESVRAMLEAWYAEPDQPPSGV